MITPLRAIIGEIRHDILHGDPPPRYATGPGFESVDLAPGRILVLAGCPGSGKSALAAQWTLAALEADPSIRALSANVEMDPSLQIQRLVSHVSGVPLTDIFERTADPARLDRGFDRLAAVADRLAFSTRPFDMDTLQQDGAKWEANLLTVDYVQRFRLGDEPDSRKRIDGIMDALRRIAGPQDVAVLVVSAVARQRGDGVSSYNGLGLASLRGSSELEFGADSVHILTRDPDAGDLLTCPKRRYGEPVDLRVVFDKARMTFTAGGPVDREALAAEHEARKATRRKARRDLDTAWEGVADA